MSHTAVRRLLHASSALVLLLVLNDSLDLLRYALMGGAVLVVAFDSVRLMKPAFGGFVTRLVPVFRTSESSKLSGASWLSIGYARAAWLPHPAATAGILAGAFADPAASWAGSTVAEPSRKKTWIGSGAAALVAALVLLSTGISLVAVVGGAAAAMALERWSGPFDDNLVVAPGVALVVWLLL